MGMKRIGLVQNQHVKDKHQVLTILTSWTVSKSNATRWFLKNFQSNASVGITVNLAVLNSLNKQREALAEQYGTFQLVFRCKNALNATSSEQWTSDM